MSGARESARSPITDEAYLTGGYDNNYNAAAQKDVAVG